MIELYKGYEIDVHKDVSDGENMIYWSIIRVQDKVKMTSDLEFGNFDTIESVMANLKSRIDKWFNLPMNKKSK